MLANLPRRPKESIPVVVDGPFVAASFPWQLLPPQPARVLVVKCTLAIVPDGAAAPLEEQAPLSGDLRFDDEPDRERALASPSDPLPEASVRYPSDFAPYKPRADVLLVGHAYPPPQPDPHLRAGNLASRLSSVQLVFGDLRRSLAVVGDRQWQGQSLTTPLPFARLPLRYERAYGGPGYEANPLGVGASGARLPNLEQPDRMIRSPHDRPAPACFGPVPPTFRARANKLGTYDQAWLRGRWPYFPHDVDWSYFNAAPSEQQIPYPHGVERFSLAGVHPARNVVNGRLPGLVARAFAALSSADRLREIPLNLDTVWFDADAMRVALVWRGLIDVSVEHAPEIAAFLVCAEQHGAAAGVSEVERRFAARLADLRGPAPEDAAELGEDQRDIATRASQGGAALASPAAAGGAFAAGDVRVPPPLARAEALARIASGASLAGADFSGCDLSDADLRRRDLRGALFSGARLDGARFDGADLSGAVLARASGHRTSFKTAVLRGANLTETALDEADLSGAVLADATLVDAALPNARFRGADLAHTRCSDARLAGAVFDEASAPGVDLSEAELTAASFRGAMLDDAQIYGSAAEGACFDNASMARLRADGARLSRATFVQARAAGASFESADLRRASFGGADLEGAVMANANLERAVLTGITARGARFRNATLSGATALKADLMEASFEGADLSHADLRGANLYAAETWRADLNGALLDQALVAGSKLA